MAVSTVVRSGLSTFDKFQRTGAGNAPSPGLFVAVGGGNIISSTDGITWTSRATGANSLVFIDRDPISGWWSAFSNNNVASGNSSWASADGTTWNSQAFGPNMRVGRSSFFTEDRQFTQRDGSNSNATIGNLFINGGSSTPTQQGQTAISGFRNRYAYAANFGSNLFSTLNGGATWVQSDTSITSVTACWVTENLFIVSSGGNIRTSTDAVTFTSRTTFGSNIDRFKRSNGLLFAASTGGAQTSILTSLDGITWSTRTIPSMQFRDVIFGAGVWVMVGYNAAGNGAVIATSSDGITWTSRTTTATALEGILFA